LDTAARNRAVVIWTLAICSLPAIAVLVASFAFTPEQMASGGPLAVVGIQPAKCPGCVLCGMSRAFCAASHLQASRAIEFNPLVALLYPLTWAVSFGGPTLFCARRTWSS
jgi:hypothetical protein